MTENDALMILGNLKPGCGEQLVFSEDEICEAIDISISALKEIQQYQEIGTLEKCEEAVEKQKPKKASDIEYDYSCFVCPNCGAWIGVTYDFESHKYCLNCGQAIQWNDDLEEEENDTSVKN